MEKIYIKDGIVNIDPLVEIEYIIKAFENSEEVFSRFSNEQIEQNLESISLGCVYNKNIDITLRKRCIESIYSLFKNLFAKRCSDYLSDISDSNNKNILNKTCYMWWDIRRQLYSNFPDDVDPDDIDVEEKTIHEEVINLMEKILYIDYDPCRESALHGLGHAVKYFHKPEKVQKIIDDFLVNNQEIRIQLKEYAQMARIGRVV